MGDGYVPPRIVVSNIVSGYNSNYAYIYCSFYIIFIFIV